MSSGYLETLKKHKLREQGKGHGFGYIVVNEVGIEHPIANTILATGGSGKERNLIRQHKEGVSGKHVPTKKTALNSEGIRVMTPTGWGRLQGFIGYAFINEEGKDEFSFPKGTTPAQQYKQFGNSVTIPVIETMAHFMLKCLRIMSDNQIAAIVQMAKKASYITKRDVMEQLSITPNRATYLLKKAKQQGVIELCGSKGRYAKYTKKTD